MKKRKQTVSAAPEQPAGEVIVMPRVAVRKRRAPLAATVNALLARVVPAILGLALLVIAWQIAAVSSKGFPTPLSTLDSALTLFADPFYNEGPNDQGIGWNVLASLSRVAVGFGLAALVGIPLGFLIGRFTFLGRMFNPLIALLRPVSPLAWLPIGLLLFQKAEPASSWTIFICSIWPMVINTAEGVKRIPEDYLNVARVLQLSEWQAASTEHETDLYQRQLDVFLDPNDPAVIEQALKDGVPQSVIDAAQQSPVWKLAMDWKLALPLHPEYRTLPMVWYVPPLSPIQSAADAGELGRNGILPDVDSLRIPVQYLANLLTAGDTAPVLLALKRMLAMRHYKRAETVDGVNDTRALEEVGLTEAQAQEMYRYLAIANYEDRFVVPSSHRELAHDAFPERNGCGFSFGDGCHGSDSKFNLFNSRRIDAIDVTVKTEPRQ
ncbi:nitrate reductase A subunit beta [Cronobacter sakazakii SP291]|nr:nitrate reductase A subunit beta [Cronobacter sakazakii SP291]